MKIMITITPIPAFNDNYIWLIQRENTAVVVDPGDAAVVCEYLEQHQLKLVGILITHHHSDHTGGLSALKTQYCCPAWGPKNDPVADLDFACQQGEQIEISELGLQLKVLDVGGHTKGHIAYFAPQSQQHENLLFCGDSLFSAGCGRLFEGTASQMWQSLQRFIDLPEDTLVFAAHEYTLANLAFAHAVEPKNEAIGQYIIEAKEKRAKGQPTLPSIIQRELKVNPFLRTDQPEVVLSAQNRTGTEAFSEIEVFKTLRDWKDHF